MSLAAELAAAQSCCQFTVSVTLSVRHTIANRATPLCCIVNLRTIGKPRTTMDFKRDKDEIECSKITTMLLKSHTGEFDLESILFLKLKNLGIYDLGCIGECINLERLDLSGNNITNLGPLSPLRRLLSLNLSANRISNLEPLATCESLQSLNVAGNVISSVDNLHSLKSLRKLENIRLKDNTYNFTNPVCKNPSYRPLILEIFPNMKVLDGERVVGRGSDLYQLCKDIDDSIKAGMYKNGQLLEVRETEPWVDDSFWEIKRSNNAIVDEAYKQFSDVLHECRLLNSRAGHLISQNERNISLKNQPKQYAV